MSRATGSVKLANPDAIWLDLEVISDSEDDGDLGAARPIWTSIDPGETAAHAAATEIGRAHV